MSKLITIGTEDYDLVVNIGGDPDERRTLRVIWKASHQDWDAIRISQLHIKSLLSVKRLVSMARVSDDQD